MRTIAAEVRLALRGWIRTPSVTLAATTSIALGVTSVTVAFSLVTAVLFRPLPGTDTPGLIRVQGDATREPVLVISHPEFVALKDDSGVFETLTAERVNSLAIAIDGQALSVGVAVVSRDYFDVLGVTLPLGPGFALDARSLRDPVVVISHDLWQAVLGGDPGVLGRTIQARGMEFVIVGVAAPEFTGAFPGFRTSAWFPLDFLVDVLPDDGDPLRIDDRFLNALGTLSAGLDEGEAHARLASLARRLSAQPDFGADRTFQIVSAGGVHPSLEPVVAVIFNALLLLSFTVLLITCANVAGLLLARAEARQGEMTSRVALGARRSQLVRQHLVESTVLGLMGVVPSIVLSTWVMQVLSAARPIPGMSVGLTVSLDGPMLLFSASVGVGAAMVFGILPAVAGSRSDLGTNRRRGSRGEVGKSWAHRLLVAVQLSVTAVLLVGAGLMIRSLDRMAFLDPGFGRDEVLTAEADLSGVDAETRRAFWARAAEAATGVPGVTSASLGQFVHLGDRADQMLVEAGDGAPDAAPLGPVNYSIIERDLLALLGIPIVAGRPFGVGLLAADPDEVLINRVLADRLWPDQDPVGRILRMGDRDGVRTGHVVGVVETVNYRRLNEAPTPFFYLPYRQWDRAKMVLHVKYDGNVDVVREGLSRRLRAIDRRTPITVRRMNDHRTVSVAVARLLRVVLSAAGLMGLIIAAVGVFGLVSYTTERRLRELAIRMAVGASGPRVRRGVILESLTSLGLALVFGIGLSLLVTPTLGTLLYGVSARDVPTLLMVTGAMGAVVVLASWLPARRATVTLNLAQFLRDS